MPRTTSATFRDAVYSQRTSEAFIVLLTIEHDDLAAPIRLSSDGVDTTSNGETFIAYPFNITFPDDPEEGITMGKFEIDNVAQDYIAAIRSISTSPTMQIDVVLASDPDTLEVSLSGFEMTNIEYTANVISFSLSVESFMNEPWPGDSFLPSTFPGLF